MVRPQCLVFALLHGSLLLQQCLPACVFHTGCPHACDPNCHGNRPKVVQAAREQPKWVSMQASKVRNFISDPVAKSLTIDGLSKLQAEIMQCLALQYGLVARMLRHPHNRLHRLQLCNGSAACLPIQDLVPYAQALSEDDVEILKMDGPSVHVLRCAISSCHGHNLDFFWTQPLKGSTGSDIYG
jgi:hypothetical protein